MAATTPIAPMVASSIIKPVNVEAWANQTLNELENLTLGGAPRVVRGTSVGLSIPLDQPVAVLPTDGTAALGETGGVALPRAYQPLRRKTSQRDSLRRREELLKGKEGSRRRQKWENDHLIGNPHAQPPLPHDWEVRPTHLVKSVPYYLASLWDAKRAEEEARAKGRESSSGSSSGGKRKLPAGLVVDGTGRVPKSLKDTIKRSRAAKTLLQEFEAEIRQFVETWNDGLQENGRPGSGSGSGSDGKSADADEDDFVVVEDDDYLLHSGMLVNPERLVFGSPEGDQSATFNRYLVHALGAYYGLHTWSVTVGDPARREAYVGIPELNCKRKSIRDGPPLIQLPRPMWARV